MNNQEDSSVVADESAEGNFTLLCIFVVFMLPCLNRVVISVYVHLVRTTNGSMEEASRCIRCDSRPLTN